MRIIYEPKTDLLYLHLDDQTHQVNNRRVCEDVVLDLGEGDRIVGIEILDASRRLELDKLLPVEYVEETEYLKVHGKANA